MIINFSPVRMDETLAVERQGDVLYINGEACDLGPLLEGATLPASAISSKWFTGQLDRIGEVLRLTLVLPHGPNAPHSTRFPELITVTGNGPVKLPVYDLEAAQ
ncbi:hypothetical protein ABRY74_11950 [Pseudomonas guariconensis]|uniref:hypothetical protein n=1 Tax=Pseudomonas guariconensis TaxID=1288410 RepID=UPI003EE14EC8